MFERRRGSGPLVVLVHGTMDRSTAFARVMGHLAEVEVVAYDRRGYGRSLEQGPPPRSVAAAVEDLFTVMAGRPAVVAGHSFGGHVAALAAVTDPGLVRAVAVWEAPLAWLPWWPADSAGALAVQAGSPEEAAETFMRRLVGDERWENLPPGTRAQRRAEGPALVADLAAIRTTEAPWTFEALAATGLPVVTGHGSESKPYHARSAVELAAAVPGADLVVIEGAAHGAHTSHPREFAAFVERAIARAG